MIANGLLNIGWIGSYSIDRVETLKLKRQTQSKNDNLKEIVTHIQNVFFRSQNKQIEKNVALHPVLNFILFYFFF